MSKFTYKAGYYWLKFRGRGVLLRKLKASHVKALYEMQGAGILELEGIAPQIDGEDEAPKFD